MVTQMDIANRLKLSRATVSRALNGENVSEKTKQMVLAEAEKLGYIPNVAATALAQKNDKLIYAFIIATIDEGYGEDTYNGIIDAINLWQGYHLKVEIVFTDINLKGNQAKTQIEQFKNVLQNKQVDGVIFSALSQENMDYVSRECLARKIPLMTLDMIYKDPSLCHAGPEYFELGTYTAAYLASLMRKEGRLLILYYDEGYDLSKERMRGFFHKLKEYPNIEKKVVTIENTSSKIYNQKLEKYFFEYNPRAIYAPYRAEHIGSFLKRNKLGGKVNLISTGINKKVEEYLYDGTIDGIVSTKPYFLGAFIMNNFFKYFYRSKEVLRGNIDVSCDIYIKEIYKRYDKIF